jgi:hypothetical protein
MSKLVIPPPDGYEVSTSSDVHNGPITPVEFDHITSGTGTSARLGFVGGYDETYDSTDSLSSDSIEITLFRFSSPAFASNFTSAAVATFSAANSDQAPTKKSYAPIVGAIALDGSKLSGNEFVDHAVVAVKGSTLMVLDYTTDNTNPVTSAFGGWAQAQYTALG